MDLMFFLQIGLVALAAGAAGLTLLGGGQRGLKITSIVVFIAVVVTGYTAFIELLGRPKPIDFSSVASHEEASTLISSFHRENEAIYLWVREQGISEPRSYILPWNLETAKQLQRAKAQAETQGAEVIIEKGGKERTGHDERTEWVFKTKAPDGLSPKT